MSAATERGGDPLTAATEGPRAEERIARTVTLVTVISGVLLGAASVGTMVADAPYLPRWFTPAAIVVVFGGLAILTAITLVGRIPVIRVAHGTYALLFLGVQVAWLPALQATMPEGLNPWVLEMATLGTVPAVIAWRAWLAWGYLLTTAVVVGVVRFVAAGGANVLDPLLYTLLTISLAAVFTALAQVVMRDAKTIDEATARLRESVARTAATSARAHEQARLDALVHDEVMSTLYYASRDTGSLRESVRSQAAAALAQLEALRFGRAEATGDLDAGTLLARMRAVVRDASPDIEFTRFGYRAAPVPLAVVEALAEATAEAVRNSLEHAPDAAHRAVNVVLSETGVEVIVQDDGRGFDPNDVQPHRLGIPLSIEGRLATLPGGVAHVSSRPGRGTVVALGWSDS